MGRDRLPQLENRAAYNLVVDFDVDLIRANSERARVQIVNVLAAIDPEVGSFLESDLSREHADRI